MGLFTERYEKTQTWAVLPSEPFDRDDAVDRLDAAPAATPAALGDGTTSVTIAMPASPAQPLEASGETAGAQDDPAAPRDVEDQPASSMP